MKPYDVYSLFDIEIVSASGSILTDSKQKKYLDLYGGHAVISVGHSHPYYVQTLTNQLKQIGFYSNSVKIPLQQELAKKLGELSGYGKFDLFLCNSGAEANENAFKLASFHNGRKKIIAFENSFHGRTSLAVSTTDNNKIRAEINTGHHVTFVPLNNEEAFLNAIDTGTCAVIIEGIQGVGGVVEPDQSFLKLLREKCNETGAALIVDEIQSGYGRTGKFFAHQYAEIEPDLITVAKGMGNGFPVAGLLIHPKFEAKKESLGTTFGGNYLACAAAISVLDILKNDGLIENAKDVGDYLITQLKKINAITDVRGKGLMIGIQLNQPCSTIRNKLVHEHGIFTGSSSDPNTLRILPALNITPSEADMFLDALKKTLGQ